MSDTRSDPRRRGTIVPLLMAGVLALMTIGALLSLKVASPTEPPFPNNSGNGEKIANAIATPPAPVPEWLSFLYPWQTLLSADLALIAALIGAWAILQQVKGSLAAVDAQIKAAREEQEERSTRERNAQIEQEQENQRRIAGAIAAELASWMNRFGNYNLLQSYKEANRSGSAPAIPPIHGVGRLSVFDGVCTSLGQFDPPLPEHIVSSYGALRGILDIFYDLRSLQPLPPFSDWDNKLAVEEARHRRLLETERKQFLTTSVHNLVFELGYFENMGRQCIDGLAARYGIKPPYVPRWL